MRACYRPSGTRGDIPPPPQGGGRPSWPWRGMGSGPHRGVLEGGGGVSDTHSGGGVGLGWIGSTPPPDTQAHGWCYRPCTMQLGWMLSAVAVTKRPGLHPNPAMAHTEWRYRHACGARLGRICGARLVTWWSRA